MNKTFLVIILLAVGLIGALFSLPKVVESNKKNMPSMSANRDAGAATKKETAATTVEAETEHQKLTDEQNKLLNKLKAKYLNAKAAAKTAAGLELAEFWAKNQYFDSAAVVAETIAKAEASENNNLATANYYYQAFTFALTDEKANEMGEKARVYYKKALDANPGLLLAKTNMAMTYVGTAGPMQGIMMLREVVAENPDFEPAVFNLGMLSMRSNQFAKAVERFKHVLKNNPQNEQASFYLGLSYARLGRNAEANETLQSLLKTTKDPAITAEINNILNELR